MIDFGPLPPCRECGSLCVKGTHGELAVCLNCLARTFDGETWVHGGGCKCELCVAAAPPRRHIDNGGQPQCGVELRAKDLPMTDTALASDCDACRGHVAINIALTTDVVTGAKKALGVQIVPAWESQPYANADAILEYVARRRSD